MIFGGSQNKCNVGYAFINMIAPSRIVPFYKVSDSYDMIWECLRFDHVQSLFPESCKLNLFLVVQVNI